ncbi:MAG TPA: hypothetical protein VHS32_38335, partial [Streptosporangiaceae bacterium]|nr:hypothetical protein [Streptosporangiaceae bacterium]
MPPAECRRRDRRQSRQTSPSPRRVSTVGALLGVLFLVAMVNEFFIASVLPGWRWLHVVMGIIFAFGAGWSFARPYNAFWTLASILGL